MLGAASRRPFQWLTARPFKNHMPSRSLPALLRHEFAGYTPVKFRQDVVAGFAVTAVALPLALAFAVASGANAAAGLVTAIVAGLVIGGLSGAPYQISGPTGSMTAVMLVLVQSHGMPGIWIAGAMAGAMLLAVGLLRLGRFFLFIPAPVITGFTTGIALIIAIGQLDNLLGVKTAGAPSAALKLLGYFHGGWQPDWHTLALGGLVMAGMLLWPTRWAARVPASLLAIIAATALNAVLQWPVKVIGAIPQTFLLAERLSFSSIPWAGLGEYVAPAMALAALGALEGLLCGAVASNLTGIRLQVNQELVAQGVGNLLIPFFGGVPATSAIARTSVGIHAGGHTRVVSLTYAAAVAACMFVLGPLLARIPFAALAGVLLVTTWHMNEWSSIRYIFGHRFKTAIITYLLTFAATITLDLTQAILIGAFLSGAAFVNQIAGIKIDVQAVDPARLRQRGIEHAGKCSHVRVAYLTGPLFFAATGRLHEAFAQVKGTHALILSLRGMPLIDTSGLQALSALHARVQRSGGTLMLTGMHADVQRMLERSGLLTAIGAENIFWGADEAIVAAEQRACAYCASSSA